MLVRVVIMLVVCARDVCSWRVPLLVRGVLGSWCVLVACLRCVARARGVGVICDVRACSWCACGVFVVWARSRGVLMLVVCARVLVLVVLVAWRARARGVRACDRGV